MLEKVVPYLFVPVFVAFMWAADEREVGVMIGCFLLQIAVVFQIGYRRGQRT